ncbi:tripartite-type tricarboxylate transporter receptor subunit TctC [Bradyrhizobium sp. RT7b]
MKAAVVLAAALCGAPAFAGWEPTKPVEIVVAAGAGGASDEMARMMQAAIQKKNLMKQPMLNGADSSKYPSATD